MNRVKITKKGYQKGSKDKGGRPPGALNKTTRVLKEAILMAAENRGDKLNGGGLTGYLEWLSHTEPSSFAALLGKVLPLQITGDDGKPMRVINATLTPQEAMRMYAETLRELNMDNTLKLPSSNAKVIDHE